MIKIISWLDVDCCSNSEIIKLMTDNNIVPLLDDKRWVEVWNKMKNPETMRYQGFFVDKIAPYMDEPYSIKIPWSNNMVRNYAKAFPDCFVGDTNPPKIKLLVDLGVQNVAYTCYGEYWDCFDWLSKLLGINIRKPFSNQISTVEKLRKLYPGKVNLFWINLYANQGKYKTLIDYAVKNDMIIGLVNCGGEETTAETLELLEEFCEELKNLIQNSNGKQN